MTISLKIEVLKVFSLEFNLSSDKKTKEEKDAKTSISDTAAKPK